jgi:hypothetical protein
MTALTITPTDVALNMLRDAIKGDVTDLQVKYFAWGDDDTANPTPNNLTTLGNELGRKAVTSRTAGAVGILDIVEYISPLEMLATIKEIAFFAGAGATAAANSGIMLGRGVLAAPITHDGTFSIQFAQTDTIARG